MADVGAIVEELAAITQQLPELRRDAFLEKIDLQNRQNELRSEAAELRRGVSSATAVDKLLALLARLRWQRDAIEKSRIDVVQQSGNTGTGVFMGTNHQGDAMRINRRIDETHGLSDLEARIGRIKGMLIDRGVDPR